MKNGMADLQEMENIFSSFGVQALLSSSRLLVALVTADGDLISWNTSLAALGHGGEKSNLYDFVPTESRSSLQDCLAERNSMVDKVLELAKPGKIGLPHHCWFVPLPDGRVLFFAEPAFEETDLINRNRQLHNELERMRALLEERERSLRHKEIELKSVLAQVDEIAHTDSQTYLPNRKYILSRLQEEVQRVERYQGALSISMVDIDHFKRVNDEYGHTVGDQALVHLSDLLNESIRETDRVGRYGGEEFLIVLPNTSLKAAEEQAARLCSKVCETSFTCGEHLISFTISLGLAQFQAGQEDWLAFLGRADAALYKAKREGRNRWAVAE